MLKITLHYPYEKLPIPDEQRSLVFQVARDSIPRLMISKVIPDSQADILRLQVGDIILKYNGKSITTSEELGAAKAKGPDVVEMVLARRDETVTVSIPRGPIGVYTKSHFN